MSPTRIAPHARGFARRWRRPRKTLPITRRRFPDPSVIADLANAFFQAPPASRRLRQFRLGVPVATPNLPEAPAPSVVTTAAPFAPARRAARRRPTSADDHSLRRADAEHSGAERRRRRLQSSTRPLGLADAAAARRLGGRREPCRPRRPILITARSRVCWRATDAGSAVSRGRAGSTWAMGSAADSRRIGAPANR